MQAVIMAGGKGTRLASVTKDEVPKPMVPVLDKPLLAWQVEKLKENGITDIYFIIGHLGKKIQEYFGDGTRFGIQASYIEEKEPLGTAGVFYDLKDRMKKEPFYLIFGDVLFDIDLARMEEFHRRSHAEATLFVHPNSHPFDSDLVEMDKDGRVAALHPKDCAREFHYRNLVNAGIYLLEASVCKQVERPVKTDLEKDVLRRMLQQGQMIYGYQSPEYVKDIGTPERIVSAGKDMKNGIVASKNLRRKQKCVFISGNAVLTKENELKDGVADALRLINQSAWMVIVAVNQPTAANWTCHTESMDAIQKRLETLLGEKGVYVDDILSCPCGCKKSCEEFIRQCGQKYHVGLSNSWMVGDTMADIRVGKITGMRTVFLKSEAGRKDKYDMEPDFAADGLMDAVKHIFKAGEGRLMVDYTKQIQDYLKAEKEVLSNIKTEDISHVMNVLEKARMDGKRVFICGNGGSASTASHFVCDFNKGVSLGLEKKYNFECLSDNVPMMMAIANDISYDDIFAIPLKGKLSEGDVVIGISGSGNSENVRRALAYAKQMGAVTVALVGYDGGVIKNMADYCIHIAVNHMQIVEDVHLILDHMMMYILSEANIC